MSACDTSVLAGALAVTAGAAWFTGNRLPSDQLSLWAVTVGNNLAGYGVVFDDRVRYVLNRGVETAPATVVRWLAVHTVLLGPALLSLFALAWRAHQARRASPEEVVA